jgi:hypothetical protein
MFSVEGLHDTVGALGELPSDVSLGIVGKQNRNVKDIQAALKDWLVTKSPQFGEAQNAYRQASVPINNMEAGQAIMDGFQGSASGNGNATVRLNQFNNARRAAVDKAEYPPDRPTQEVLDAISKDLQRATVSNAGGTPGSSTAMNLKSDDWVTRLLMSGAKGGSSGAADTAAATIGTILGGPGGGAAAHYGVGKVGSWLNGRLLDAWTEALLNPELAASLVEKYQPSQALGPLSIVAPSGGTNAVINP